MASDFNLRQQNRMGMLARLKKAVDEYVFQEQARIDTEVAVLSKVLEGRRSGQGAAGGAAQKASRLAETNLGLFLRGY
jgi:hypothetical protein